MVRVLVGRMEIMSPEDESRATAIVKKSLAARDAELVEAKKNKKSAAGLKWPKELDQLGRLVEPALVRVSIIAADRKTRNHAKSLLWLFPKRTKALQASTPKPLVLTDTSDTAQ